MNEYHLSLKQSYEDLYDVKIQGGQVLNSILSTCLRSHSWLTGDALDDRFSQSQRHMRRRSAAAGITQMFADIQNATSRLVDAIDQSQRTLGALPFKHDAAGNPS
jgi:hypothetical protein